LKIEVIVGNPCLRCGACCAYYRVSFYWAEAEPFLGGSVPTELTEPLSPYRAAMQGTLRPPARCVCLEGQIGDAVCCSIYEKRPSPCHELQPWDENGQPDEKCTRARTAHDLPPLNPVKPLAPGMLPDPPLRTGTG
jgi:Fe-S-cluster containining protein